MLVQCISGILRACNMQISNSKLCESSKCREYSAVSHPWLDEHAFPPMGFAVARLSCSLQNESNRKFPSDILKLYNTLSAI